MRTRGERPERVLDAREGVVTSGCEGRKLDVGSDSVVVYSAVDIGAAGAWSAPGLWADGISLPQALRVGAGWPTASHRGRRSRLDRGENMSEARVRRLMDREAGLRASRVRTRKPGDGLLARVSTRRLVPLSVHL
jgi:hypothetical protein